VNNVHWKKPYALQTNKNKYQENRQNQEPQPSVLKKVRDANWKNPFVPWRGADLSKNVGQDEPASAFWTHATGKTAEIVPTLHASNAFEMQRNDV